MQHGQRYVGELHVRVKGDMAAGQRALPAARLLMGEVLAAAQHNSLNQHTIRRQLGDGTVLVAEKIGAINRVTIVPPGGEPPAPTLFPPEDFVAWPRNVAFPNGIDDEFPQQILRAGAASEGTTWTTFFFNSETAGYEAFARDKGTYGGLFPEGLRRAGNIDWRSKQGAVISWYGPYHRYWLEAFVQPRHQFGKFVFMLGEVVLDTDQYAIDSPEQVHGEDRYILGAALRKTGALWQLYTVQSEANDEAAPVSGTNASSCAAYGCIWPRADNVAGIYRYSLRVVANAAGIGRLEVIPESREQLASMIDSHCEPWFFNQSCTRAHAFLFPTDSWLVQRDTMITPHDPPPDFVEFPLPGSSQVLREALIDEEGAVTLTESTVSCPPASTYAPFARDYKGDEAVDALVANYASVVVPGDRRMGVRYDVAGLQFTGGSTGDPAVNPWQADGWGDSRATAWFVYADLRQDLLVLLLMGYKTYTPEDPASVRYQFRIFQAGEQVHVEDLPELYSHAVQIPPMPGSTINAPLAQFSDRAYPPQFFLFASHCCARSYDTISGAYAYTGSTGAALGSAMWFPRPSWEYFGLMPATYLAGNVQWARAWTSPYSSDAGGASTDFDGHRHPLSCAVKDGVAMLSGWRPRVVLNPTPSPGADLLMDFRHAWSYVTDDDMRDLTGVSGERPRYHPIWLLGKPPRTA